MTALNACLDFYSNDFSNPLTKKSYLILSSILSTLESCDETQPIVDSTEEWNKLVIEHIYLPNSQPNVSQLKQQVSKLLTLDYIQLSVNFYTLKFSQKNIKDISEKDYDSLQELLWKFNTCVDKNEIMNQDRWEQLKPHKTYSRDRNTGKMVLNPFKSNHMPRQAVSVNHVISKIKDMITMNYSKISQIKLERAEKERLAQEALDAQAAQAAAQVEEAVEEPEWDHEPSSTQLVVEPEVAEEPTPEEPVVEEAEPTPEEPEPTPEVVGAEPTPEPEVIEAEPTPEPEVEAEPEVVEAEPTPEEQ